MSFLVSSAKMDITPPPGMNPFMAGYGSLTGPRRVADDTPHARPLYARCVVIWQERHPFAIVSLDILGIPRALHLALRARLVPLAAWQSSDIVLVASHTHNGPVIGRTLDPVITYGMGPGELALVDVYTAWLQDRIVAVVTRALASRRLKVQLEYGVTAAGFAYNRAGLGTVETDVPVLVARRLNGDLRAVLFSYGCHPVSAGGQELWDGDWPAAACAVIEDETSAFALFIPGPAGDQDPAGVRSWALRDEHGQAAGHAVIDAADSGRILSGPISSDFREVTLPLDIDESPANLAAVRATFEVRMLNPAGLPAWYARHGAAMVDRIDNGTYATSVQNPSQVWRIGGDPGVQLAFVGGELVSGYGAYFRLRFGGAEELMIGGYANETNSYIPADNFLLPLAPAWGSYEGGWDADAPGIAGGSMTIYPQIAHFLAGAGGVESAVIDALTEQLS
ncbi:hypothetical protein [Microbacterium jejuense]|uniref:hypothetical protein n=1 Tax=Microbacterium jejuense TaxID=1263637 RepID=UPI0031EF7659